MNGLKSYVAYTGRKYGLLVWFGSPILILAIHICLRVKVGMDMGPLLLMGWIGLEIIADYWHLGGIQSKECEKMDYLRTSFVGVKMVQDILLWDMLRRLVTIMLLTTCMLIIDVYVVNDIYENGHLNIIMNYCLIATLCFTLSQTGVLIGRFWGYFGIHVLIAYLALGMSGLGLFWIFRVANPFAQLACFLAVSILSAVLSVMIGRKKMEEGFYDE